MIIYMLYVNIYKYFKQYTIYMLYQHKFKDYTVLLFGYSYDYYIIEINTKVERLRVGIREGTKTGLKHDVIIIGFKI